MFIRQFGIVQLCAVNVYRAVGVTDENPKLFKKKLKSYLTQLTRSVSSKQESYFSAIGGDSQGPPPDLTPQQVTTILRANEYSILRSINTIKLIECNQLASNNPIEDRLRISKLNLAYSANTSKDACEASGSSKQSDLQVVNQLKELSKFAMLCGVIDGHGGEACADLIAHRLYSYIAVALLPDATELIRSNQLSKVVQDLYVTPPLFHSSSSIYDSTHLQHIKEHSDMRERQHLLKFAEYCRNNPAKCTAHALKLAFERADADMAAEIIEELDANGDKISTVLQHYYLSLAASGCCVTILLADENNRLFVASTGDCKAVMATEDDTDTSRLKFINLSNEHDADNIEEIKRLYAAHPMNERNQIVRRNRLLGQLMPLRAFGDFCYKWDIDTMRRTGMIKAFGPHIIPPNYITPPYLIVEPEVAELQVEMCSNDHGSDRPNRFIILATDGLWEQFSNARQVMKNVLRHRKKLTESESSTHNEAPEVANNAETTSANAVDPNTATYLLRNALGQTFLTQYDSHVQLEEILRHQHERLVTFLTLPQSVVRNFRDDISLIVLHLK